MALTLKAARVNSGLTQEEAAIRIGVTNDTICRWENQKSFPNVPQIQKIEEVYGLSYQDINFYPESPI